MVARAGGVAIGRLRARVPGEGAGVGPVGLRLRLDHLLGSADLRPPGLPPSAILIVHRFTVPALLDVSGVPAGTRIGPGWERAARARLGELARVAARPDRGPVPRDAEAVCFDGEAELLACLALDLVRGRAGERWWWRGIVRALPTSGPAGLAPLLLNRPEAVPAALEALARRGEAVAVARALAPREAATVLAAVLRVHGITSFSPAHYVPSEGAIGVRGPWSEEPERVSRVGGDASAEPVKQAPWAAWWPDGSDFAGRWPVELGKEQSCLLGVALGLRLRPATVQSERFWAAVREWWRDDAAGRHGRDRGGSVGPARDVIRDGGPSSPEAERPVLKPTGTLKGAEDGGGIGGVGAERPVRLAPRPDDFRSAAPLAARGLVDRERAGPRVRPDDGVGVVEHGAGIGGDVDPDRGAERWARLGEQDGSGGVAESAGSTRLDLRGGLETQLGGVFYLLNLMDYLGLPDCFEAGWGLATEVGTYGALEAIARGLLAGGAARRQRRFARDPVWAVLAELARRAPGEPVGVGCRDGGAFALPEAWAVERAGLTARTRQADGRSPWEVAESVELAGPLVEGIGVNMRGWLGLALPYVRWRLRLALDPMGRSRRDVAAGLLRRSGIIYVNETNVDLVMDVGQVSLAARLAGLDRDPGWSRTGGRLVRFHFEGGEW